MLTRRPPYRFRPPRPLLSGFDRRATALTVGVALDDSRSCLGAYDGNNNIRAVLESDDDAMHEWARGVYQHYRERATPLEVLYGDESAVEGIER